MVFSCHVNVSYGWQYMWYQDMTLLIHSENKLSISPGEKSDQGSYECQAKRGTDQLFFTDKSQAVNIIVEGQFMRFCVQQILPCF